MRRLRFLGVLCLLALGPVQASAQTIAIDKVLVIVNNEAITLSEYQARHQRELLQQSMEIEPFNGQIDLLILNRMIDDRKKWTGQSTMLPVKMVSVPND
jgi:hypothetical protein